MVRNSVIKSTQMRSPLQGFSTLKPKGGKNSRQLLFSLSLTSLIDAFSILVIFLLMNVGSGQEVNITKGMTLPTATQGETIAEEGVVVTVNQGRYFIESNELTRDQVFQHLYQMDKKKSLILEADKATSYEALSPIIVAAGQAGIEKFKFAVLPGKEN